MNLKTTLALVAVAAVGGIVWWVGPELPSWLSRTPPTPAKADEGTLEVFRGRLTEENLRLIRIFDRHGEEVLFLMRGNAGKWVMPGGWPTRDSEIKELVGRLGSMGSRFAPVPLPDDEALRRRGLDAPEYTARVTARSEDGTETYRLAFGRGRAEGNEFSRPTFVRLGGRREAIRLGPGLPELLGRPRDYYQRRRLLPTEEVAKSARPLDRGERPDASAIQVERTAGEATRFTVAKDARGWHLSSPSVDRLDPEKRDALLTAVANLWAERFVKGNAGDVVAAVGAPLPGAGLVGAVSAVARAGVTDSREWLLLRTGLDRPERTVRVTHANGTTTLLIGRVSRKLEQPADPMAPFPLPGAAVEFRYAKLRDNEQIFEIKAGKLKDLFVAPGNLRDTRLARFDNKEVRRVEIEQGKEKLTLLRDDKDRWKVESPGEAEMLAEEEKVTELLDKLTALTVEESATDAPAFATTLAGLLMTRPGPASGAALASMPERFLPGLAASAFDKPLATVRLTIKDKDGSEGAKAPREVVLHVGKHDEAGKRLLVRVGDWPRVSIVEDGLWPLVKRPALAYRGQLFDFATADVTQIVIEQEGEKITLVREDDNWRMTVPADAEADTARAEQLADTLGRLEPVEYLSEDADTEELESKYGLGKPPLSATVQFKNKLRTLHVGKRRGDKQEYFAKLADGDAVFVVGAEVHDALKRDSLSYLPLELWSLGPSDIAGVRVAKEGAKPYALERSGGGWKVAAPYDAATLDSAVRPMIDLLANPVCDHYVAHDAGEGDKYGLEKPYLRVTVAPQGPDAKARELVVGAAVKDGGGRYAKLGNGSAVFVLRPDVVRNLDRPALEVLDTLLLNVSLDDVQSIKKEGDNPLALQAKDDAWAVTDAPGAPYPADEQAAASLRATLFNLRAERYAAYGPDIDWKTYGLDKPFAKLTLALKEDARTVELGGAVKDKPGQRYARIDGKPGVAVLTPADTKVLARTHLDYVNRNVLAFDAGQVTAVVRQKGGEALEIARRDGDWRLLKPETHRADNAAVDDLVRQLSDLRAAGIAAYPLREPEKFGLDKPFAVLTVRLGGGADRPEHTITLGAEVEGKKGRRYARVDDGQAVAVLPEDLTRKLGAAPIAFRNKELARFGDADRIVLERGPRKATFARQSGTWKMIAPLEAGVDHDRMEAFLNAAARLKADELVADKPGDLKPYGLDRPTARWRFQSGDRDVLDLVIGKTESPGGRAYARLGNGNLVFLLDPELTKKALGEYRERTVFATPLDAAQVDTLRLTRDGKTLVLKKAGDAWQAEGKPEVKLEAGTVNDTVAALTGLKLERYAVDKGADLKLYGLEPPKLVIEAAVGGRTMALHVGHTEGDSKRVYARVPEAGAAAVLVLSEADSARLTRTLEDFTRPVPKKEGSTPPGFPTPPVP